MKIKLMCYISIVLSCVASCQEVPGSNYELTVVVIDENGDPLQGAEVHTSRLEITSNEIVGTMKRNPIAHTDSAGIANITYKSIHHGAGGPAPGALVSKNGWYSSTTQKSSWPNKIRGDINTYSQTVHAILKPIKNPIPMYAYCNMGAMGKSISIPEFDKEYGFDLQLAEALPPLGSGKIADFFFRLSGSNSSDSEYDMTLNIHFPGEYNGVVEFMTPERTSMREPVRRGSSLLSDHQAPSDKYVSEITRRDTRPSIEIDVNNRNDVKRNFYFRTRSVVDSEGNLIQAN